MIDANLKREEIQKQKEVIAETVKLILEARHINVELCFGIIQSEQVTLSTDITDHIVEDHTSVQDHITIKPLTFTLKGLISEKVYEAPNSVDIDLPEEPMNAKLAKLGTLSPIMSSYVSSAINAGEAVVNRVEKYAGKVGNVIDAGVRKLLKFIGYRPSANYYHKKWSDDMWQLTWITILDTCRTYRIPVVIQTGWGNYYEDMYITDITVNQGDTYQQADLSVTVKQLRFTSIKMDKVTNEDLRNIQQSLAENDVVTGQVDDNKTNFAREVDKANKAKK